VKPRGLGVENGVTLHFANGRTRVVARLGRRTRLSPARTPCPGARGDVAIAAKSARASSRIRGRLRACGAAVSGFRPPALVFYRFTLRSLPAPERSYRRPSRYPSFVASNAETSRRVALGLVPWMQLNEQVERCYLLRLPQTKEWHNGYHD
jgi:hypothetical protein